MRGTAAKRSGLIALAITLGTLASASSALAAGYTWTAQNSGTTSALDEVSCGDNWFCAAVGSSGTIVTTANNGQTWTTRSSGTTATLRDVSCPTSSKCLAVGTGGTLRATVDGGVTWTSLSSGTNVDLDSVHCASATHCWTGSSSGQIRATTNFGTSWTLQHTISSGEDIYAIACGPTTHCWAGGMNGTILATTNGGTSWSPQTSAPNSVRGFSCLNATQCWAVGYGGFIRATTNGGQTWTAQNSGTGNGINGISCPTTTQCWAGSSSILTTANGGATWTTESSPINTIQGISCAATTCSAVGFNGAIAGRAPVPDAPVITSKPANQSAASVSFAFTGESGATFECQLDAGTFSSCSSPKSYSGLAGGSHTFAVRQKNAYGNTGPAASYTWTVDGTAPAAPTITSGPSTVSTSKNATFKFTGEAGAYFECQLDQAGWAGCSSPQSYSGLADGDHTFQVRQTDTAGNTSIPRGVRWVVVSASEVGAGAVANYFTTGYAWRNAWNEAGFSVDSGPKGCDSHAGARVVGTSASPSTGTQCYFYLSGTVKRRTGLLASGLEQEVTATGTLYAFGPNITFSFTTITQPCGAGLLYCGRISAKGTDIDTGLPFTVEGTISMTDLVCCPTNPIITGSLTYYGTR